MAQLRCEEVSSEIAKKNIDVWKEVVREGNLLVYYGYISCKRTMKDLNLLLR